MSPRVTLPLNGVGDGLDSCHCPLPGKDIASLGVRSGMVLSAGQPLATLASLVWERRGKPV